MKAITIHQPWATLIAVGAKQFETRSWTTKYRGPFAIHAGKKIDREAYEHESIKSVLAEYRYTIDDLPIGAVVATCNLSECWAIGLDYQSHMPVLFNAGGGVTKPVSKREDDFGFYFPGRFAWELANVKRLPDPIPAKGQQGLWNWEGEGE